MARYLIIRPHHPNGPGFTLALRHLSGAEGVARWTRAWPELARKGFMWFVHEGDIGSALSAKR